MTDADKLRDIKCECLKYFETWNADYDEEAVALAGTILDIIDLPKEGE